MLAFIIWIQFREFKNEVHYVCGNTATGTYKNTKNWLCQVISGRSHHHTDTPT